MKYRIILAVILCALAAGVHADREWNYTGVNISIGQDNWDETWETQSFLRMWKIEDDLELTIARDLKYFPSEKFVKLTTQITTVNKLIHGLRYLKIVDSNAGIKVDVNVSIPGISERVEIKNVNSLESIKKVSNLIDNIELRDIFNENYTFRIWYQDPNKTLTDEEVKKIRENIIEELKRKFGGTIKN